jgi:hypothetical protein
MKANKLNNDNSKEGVMKKWIKKLERAFVAISFAEMGEHHIAMEMSGIRPWKKKNCLTLWDEIFIEVTFAEAV